MKKNIIKSIILVFCLQYYIVYAQTLTITPTSPINVNGTTNDWYVVANSYVHNLSGNNLNLVWKRIVISTPTQWQTGVCDNIGCHVNSTDSAQFSLAAGDSGILTIHFYPYNTTGNGTVRLTVYEQGNMSNVTSVDYNADVTLFTGINEKYVQEKIILSPNPINNSLFVQYPGNYQGEFEIFNILGIKVQSTKADGKSIRFNLPELPSGIYFLRFKNEKGIVVTKNFVKE